MTTLGFTRPSKRIKESVAQAEAMGFAAMGAPSLDILPGEDAEFARLEDSVSGDCIAVFCSSTAVEECQSRYGDSFRGMFDGKEVVSIGPATTSKLMAAGIGPDTVPEEYSSEGIVDALKGRVSGRTVVLLRSDSGSDVLSDGLEDAGADVRDIAVYRLEDAGESIALLHLLTMIKQGRLDVMAFTSPMSASMFVSRVERRFGKEDGDRYLRNVAIAAIGGPTSRRLEELGFPPDIVPGKATFADMLEAVRKAFPERASEQELEAAGDLPAGGREEVHLGVLPFEDVQGGLPIHDRDVLVHDPVHASALRGHRFHVPPQVPEEVDAVVADVIPVEVDDPRPRLLRLYLADHKVPEVFQPVESESGDGRDVLLRDEIVDLRDGVPLGGT